MSIPLPCICACICGHKAQATSHKSWVLLARATLMYYTYVDRTLLRCGTMTLVGSLLFLSDHFVRRLYLFSTSDFTVWHNESHRDKSEFRILHLCFNITGMTSGDLCLCLSEAYMMRHRTKPPDEAMPSPSPRLHSRVWSSIGFTCCSSSRESNPQLLQPG